MATRSTLFAILICCGSAVAADKVTYQDHIKPILREHCFACHSQDDANAGLALDTYDAALAGGGGGEVLAPADADGSRLWRLVTHAEEPKMPPGDKMPDEQLALLKKWIDGGLLDNSGSKPKQAKRSAIGKVEVSEGNRPKGEPAMPTGLFRQPVVVAPRVGPVTSLAASPWAPVVAVPWQRQVSLYHASDLRLLGVLAYPDGVANVVRFSRDGSLLLVAGGSGAKSGSATVFDVKTGSRLTTVGDELDAVLAADISPDLSLVAIGGPKKKVRAYRTADGTLAYTLGKHTDWVTALEFSPDGALLATADRNAGLLVWQAATGNPRADLRGHKQAVTGVAWRGDSAVLASASEDGEVRLWKRDGQPLKNFRAHGGGVQSVAFARDGRLATAGRDRKVAAWSAEGKQFKQYGPMSDMGLAAVFAAEDKRLVASDFAGAIKVFDTASGELVGGLSPNPSTLATRQQVANAERDKLKKELAPLEAKLAAAQKELAAADEAHAAFLDKLAKATAAAAACKKAAEEQRRIADATKAKNQKQSEAVAAAKKVLEAAEAALAVANKNLASPKDGEDSPGAVVQALAKAVDEAKREEKKLAEQAGKLVQEANAAMAASDKAVAAAQKLEQTLAQVNNQRAGLPDLAAARAAVEREQVAVEALRSKLSTAKQRVASVASERAEFAKAMQAREAEAKKLAEQRDRLSEQSKAAGTAAAEAQQRAQAKQARVKELAAQLAKLQAELKASEAASEKAQADGEKLAGEAETVRQQLADAELAAEAAEARRAQFAAAEAAREKYLKE